MPDSSGLAEWEKNGFGITNNDAVATLMEVWRFPFETVKASGEHFALAERHLPLTQQLNLAANMADKIGYDLPGESGYGLETDEVHRKAGVKLRDAKPFMDRA